MIIVYVVRTEDGPPAPSSESSKSSNALYLRTSHARLTTASISAEHGLSRPCTRAFRSFVHSFVTICSWINPVHSFGRPLVRSFVRRAQFLFLFFFSEYN